MQTLSLVLNFLAAALLLLLGAVVLASGTRLSAKRWFVALCWVLIIWLSANYFADVDIVRSLFWTRLTFFSVTLAAAFLVLFVRAFPAPAITRRRYVVTFWLATVVTSILVWTDWFIPAVEFQNGTSNVITGSLYFVFVIYFTAIIIASIAWLFSKMRQARGISRERVRLVLIGFLIMAFFGSLTNLILPLIFDANPLARYGGFSVLFFVAIVTYSIVKHRLFSIRLVIARSLTYLLTLGTLALFFTIVIFGVVGNLTTQQVSPQERVIYALFATFAALVYQPLKRFFDRLSRKVFFRDLYDSRDVLDKLGDIAAHNTLPDSLLAKSLAELSKVLHPSFIVAYVYRGKELKEEKRMGKSVEIPNGLLQSLPKETIIITETDQIAPYAHEAVERLEKAGVALVAHLQTSGETIGFVVFGYKLTGSGYNSQDILLLSTVADELAVAVQNALRFEEISHFNEKLRQEVQDATAQLRDSNRKLKKLDEAKDEFISMASHQLRTPLTSVKGYISMALDGDAGKLTESQEKLLQEAFSSAQRMVYLIGDFLNVSRLQTGKFVLEPKPTNLAEVVSDEINQMASTAARRGIAINYDKPADFPVLMLDDNKMRQVIMNFIDNAIFYSKPAGVVDVTLVNTGREIRLEVHDNGIGVPEADRHKLFTKFFRAENARRVRPDGTGIGLFMAKKVVSAHGGSIIFSSRENHGSTFGFSLPLKDQSQQLVQQVSKD